MILWERSRRYNGNLSSNARRELAEKIATSGTIKAAILINWLINICIPLVLLYFFGFDLIVLACAFVLADIALMTFDQLVFVTIPHIKTTSAKLRRAQKRLDKILTKRDELNKQIAKIEMLNCNHLCNRRCNSCKLTSLKANRRVLNRFISDEQAYINKELAAAKETAIKQDDSRSDDYSNKMNYLLTIKESLDYFVETKAMDFLIPIQQDMQMLIETLNKKQMGHAIVSSKIYIYLDELKNILDKLADLSIDQQYKYVPDIKRIADALSKTLDALITKINTLETEDIEISIAVLLQELEGDKHV
jgi:hypothetical protein